MITGKMKDNSFKQKKERRRRYPAQTFTDVDYADDIALLANIPAQAETLLRSLKWAADGIPSMSMQLRRNISALIKQVISSH